MGCDIHMVVEAHTYLDDGNTKGWRVVIAEPAAYGSRNYNVFGALAGVRRDGPMIAAPRGLPDDISPEARAWAKAAIDHTPSWLLLSEVLAFNWAQPIHMTGVVNAAGVLSMLRRGTNEPEVWSGWADGDDVKYVTLAELTAKMRALGEIPEIDDAVEDEFQGLHHHFVTPLRNYYVEHTWSVPLEQYCSAFITWARGLMDPHSVTRLRWCDPSEIRLVFGFDS